MAGAEPGRYVPFRDEALLAQDLGLDSLARAELVLWLAKEFGFADVDVESIRTVGDVMLAARGQAIRSHQAVLKPVPRAWFRDRRHQDTRLDLPPGDTLTSVFLEQARRGPGRAVIADQLSGARTYRDLITAILVLKPLLEKLPGQRVGIMLPASVAANVVYLTALFAGKVPVMVNWTTGARNVAHSLDLTEVRNVLTVRPLVARLESQGIDLSALKDRFLFLEDLRQQVSLPAKLWAGLRSRVSWASLARVAVPETAVILLTSGSESLPKAVPLTHANLLTNIRDVLRVFAVHEDDAMIGFLPPFHSFGVTVTMLLPMLTGARAVYHANPTEAWMLARLIEAYGATLLCGTPTFLSGIVRAATGNQLASLRLAVTGAEKCPQRVHETLAERCSRAVILEGYGITECSPIVSVNCEADPKPGTIGKVLPSLEYAVVDVDTGQPAGPNQIGMLLVRGPSVFGGYLGNEAASPFVDFANNRWYRTGDLVSEDADHVLTFRGRLKRFVKLGGEMISLPAIEAALEPHYIADADEGPVLAVEATPHEDHPELVLFATRDIDRQTANRLIREAGLSPLHNISRVVRLEQIPVLGTGKTDYRTLKASLI
jgi:acyl-CoA synthetase (AMP-forming)/AMP-acid ligase II